MRIVAIQAKFAGLTTMDDILSFSYSVFENVGNKQVIKWSGLYHSSLSPFQTYDRVTEEINSKLYDKTPKIRYDEKGLINQRRSAKMIHGLINNKQQDEYQVVVSKELYSRGIHQLRALLMRYGYNPYPHNTIYVDECFCTAEKSLQQIHSRDHSKFVEACENYKSFGAEFTCYTYAKLKNYGSHSIDSFHKNASDNQIFWPITYNEKGVILLDVGNFYNDATYPSSSSTDVDIMDYVAWVRFDSFIAKNVEILGDVKNCHSPIHPVLEEVRKELIGVPVQVFFDYWSFKNQELKHNPEIDLYKDHKNTIKNLPLLFRAINYGSKEDIDNLKSANHLIRYYYSRYKLSKSTDVDQIDKVIQSRLPKNSVRIRPHGISQYCPSGVEISDKLLNLNRGHQ